VVRLASLPMYDLPEIRSTTLAWWRGLARHFRNRGVEDVPDGLAETPSDPHDHWISPDLMFSQTCGFPLATRLSGRVRVVATPCYAAPGCRGADYVSRVVVAENSVIEGYDRLSGGTLAVNSWESHSGYNVLRGMPGGLGHFAAMIVSGGHRHGLRMVAEGEADAAAVDAVTHALLAEHAPAALAGTRVLCDTPAAPGLPYVTSIDTDPERLRAGLTDALADPALSAVREALLLSGAEVVFEEVYRLAMYSRTEM
jgi:ABC-type phosphate/phosphonate transport system substrate-binding protein